MFRVLALTALVGCAPDPTDCPSDAPRLSVTQASDTAQELVEGQPVPIVFGPQGGHHIAFGVRIDDPEDRYALRVTVDHDGERIADDTYEGPIRHRYGCTDTLRDLWAFLDDGPLEGRSETADARLVGEAFTLQVTLTTDSGTTTRTLTLIGAEDA